MSLSVWIVSDIFVICLWCTGRISLDKEWTVLFSRRAQIFIWYFCRFLWTHSEQFYPHSYVLLLWTVCVSIDAQVSLVEEISHTGATGMFSLLSALLYIKLIFSWIGKGNRSLSLLRSQRLFHVWWGCLFFFKNGLLRMKLYLLKCPFCVQLAYSLFWNIDEYF